MRAANYCDRSLAFAFASALPLACASAPTPVDHVAMVGSACTGISGAEVQRAVETIRPDIDAVGPKTVPRYAGKTAPWPQLVGAIIYVRAMPGITEEYMTRLLQCHALAPAPCSAKGRCPFALHGIHVSTMPLPTGFAVSIESQDPDIADEILRRSQELRRPP
jgi:hypothetical protein